MFKAQPFYRTFSLLLVVPLFLFSIDDRPLVADQSAPITGTITRVTLYRGQALVSRRIEIDGAAGSREIVVSDLPNTMLAGSLYADSTAQVEVRAVRYRQRAVGEEPREEVRLLDEQIADHQRSIHLNQKQTELAAQKLAYLDQLQGFVAPTAGAELTSGVLNAETLKQLTEFSFEQRAAIVEEQVGLAKSLQELNQALDTLKRQRAELTKKSQRTVNEAVLFLEKLDGAPQAIELNYLVSQCGWTPNYTIKANDDRSQVQIEYNALIEQITGEDWAGVELTLSTASPALSASGPSLAPFAVGLISTNSNDLQTMQVADSAILSQNIRDNRLQQQAYNVVITSSIDFRSKTTGNWSLNKTACSLQELELTNPYELLRSATVELGADRLDAPSLSYQLSSPVSLASRTDQQMVRIYRGNLASEFYHVATPLLSNYVFREAEVNNSSEYDFLSGPVTVYLDGRFVGRAEIPTVAQGETFVLGFGSDAQLRAHRELTEKKESVQGGNKELRIGYRLSVENYKNKAVKVRLFDRLPYSNRANDVRVTLGRPSVELSDDAVYIRRERPKNILRWDIEVPADAGGERSLTIDYDFTLDYDRNFVLADASNEQAADEFEKLERSRQKR